MGCSSCRDRTSLARRSNAKVDEWIVMCWNVSTRILHPWSAASSPERLTPRGGPRQISVVGVRVSRRLEDDGCTAAPVTFRLLVTTNVAWATSCGEGESRLPPMRTAFISARMICP